MSTFDIPTDKHGDFFSRKKFIPRKNLKSLEESTASVLDTRLFKTERSFHTAIMVLFEDPRPDRLEWALKKTIDADMIYSRSREAGAVVVARVCGNVDGLNRWRALVRGRKDIQCLTEQNLSSPHSTLKRPIIHSS